MRLLFQKTIHFFQRLIAQSRLFPKYLDEFGLKMALYIVFDRLFPPGRSKGYINAVYQYLNSEYGDIAAKYSTTADSKQTSDSAKIIWACWFQGEEAMPGLVEMCYRNLKEKIKGDDIQLRLITYENIDRYVAIPSHIKEKHRQGIISNAHYSDIIRFKLLKEYGGCWTDLTVYSTDFITEELFKPVFTSLKMPPERCPKEPSRGLWSGFFFAGHKGFTLFSIMDECLERYWSRHSLAIDYIFFDYFMLLAYDHSPIVKAAMDAVPYNNENLWFLWDNIEQKFSDRLYQEILRKGRFYKLSYQRPLAKEIDGNPTVYGYLCSK